MKLKKLVYHGRFTHAYHALLAGCDDTGTTVTRYALGFTDFDTMRAFVEHGMMEIRRTGPRGGARYHTTKKGRQALQEARDMMNETGASRHE